MAKTSPSITKTASGENHLHRAVGLRGLTMISLGSIIGSGWLLGALTAATVAGGASLVSWILGAAIIALLALVHAELGSTYPVSGGTARFPFITFGALGGFTGGWMAWLQAVTIAPIEVEATLGYLNSHFTTLDLLSANGTLTGKGILIGAGFMLVFSVINTMGVRWLSETAPPSAVRACLWSWGNCHLHAVAVAYATLRWLADWAPALPGAPSRPLTVTRTVVGRSVAVRAGRAAVSVRRGCPGLRPGHLLADRAAASRADRRRRVRPPALPAVAVRSRYRALGARALVLQLRRPPFLSTARCRWPACRPAGPVPRRVPPLARRVPVPFSALF